MELFVGVNSLDGRDSLRVQGLELCNLLLQVSKNHALDGNSRSGDGLAPTETGSNPQHEAAQGAQVITTAARSVTAIELCVEYRTVPTLVLPELAQSGNEAGGCQTC